MAEYAISTNLIGWAPISKGMFGWPLDGPEGETVLGFRPGDILIPKFAQNPEYLRAGGQREYQRAVCWALDLDYEEELRAYNEKVAGGDGAISFLLIVSEPLPPNHDMPSGPWAMAAVERHDLIHPISTQEFLKLRATPLELARQFKAMAAPGRHIQKVPNGTAAKIADIGEVPRQARDPLLRRFSLVRAGSAPEAAQLLRQAGRAPLPGDRAVLVNTDRIPGVHAVTERGLEPDGEEIAMRPDELMDLFDRAKRRGTKTFRPAKPLAAASALADFLASGAPVRDVESFANYHDWFVRLPRNVNQALQIARRPLPTDPPTPAETSTTEDLADEEDPTEEELQDVLGLTAEAVRKRLPDFALADSVLNEAVAALRSGKHLLLTGPPGTGKSTLANAVCRAVVDEQFDVTTATADWTTFDTIGGYLPTQEGTLRFEPGIVLRALESSHWLVIDELNRADIDKAFGPLFTLLAGTGDNRPIVLPYRGRDGKSIRIGRADAPDDGVGPYTLTPSWRLIGTLNASDKATLFQLSFAFMRRFAIVDVPLPDRGVYTELFDSWLDEAEIDGDARQPMVDAAIDLATGPRPLGPAILRDVATFVGTATTRTQAGPALFSDPIDAFTSAVRLYAVPQYEGADRADVDRAMESLVNAWPDRPADSWRQLGDALTAVALG